MTTATVETPARGDSARTLTADEAARLAELEARIKRGFQEVGLALREIRDARLYRETHPTFEGYCRERWDFSDRRARQFMDAAEIGTMVPVENERQARALAPLKDDEKAVLEVWGNAKARAEELDRPLTAAMVKEAVEERIEYDRLSFRRPGGGQIALLYPPGTPLGDRLPLAPGTKRTLWNPTKPEPIALDEIPRALAAHDRAQAASDEIRAERALPPVPENSTVREWRRRQAEAERAPDPLEREIARLRESRAGRPEEAVIHLDTAIASVRRALEVGRNGGTA
jgi:hypothetical protein